MVTQRELFQRQKVSVKLKFLLILCAGSGTILCYLHCISVARQLTLCLDLRNAVLSDHKQRTLSPLCVHWQFWQQPPSCGYALGAEIPPHPESAPRRVGWERDTALTSDRLKFPLKFRGITTLNKSCPFCCRGSF